MTTDALWLHGALLPRATARLDPLAHGHLYGAGLYDTILLRHGVPVALDRHLLRLTRGAARLGLTAPDKDEVQRALAALSAAHGLHDGRLRITLSAGPSPNVHPAAPQENTVLITLAPLAPGKASAALTLTPFRRNEHSPLAGLKHTSCAENLLAQRAALTAGADEALFLNTAGQLCEGAFSNIFLITAGTVLTPPLESGCLPGITREIILELCAAHAIPCSPAPLPASGILTAGELFLTSSLRGVQPVHRLDDYPFPAPGPLTARLAALYAAWLERTTRSAPP